MLTTISLQSPAGPGAAQGAPKTTGLRLNPTLDCSIAQFCRVLADVAEIEPRTFIFVDVQQEICLRKDEVAHSMSFISA
jgi:hypothetical protein